MIDQQALLQEASTWAIINWSAVGSRYGLTQPNRGQIIKEFSAETTIASARNSEQSKANKVETMRWSLTASTTNCTTTQG